MPRELPKQYTTSLRRLCRGCLKGLVVVVINPRGSRAKDSAECVEFSRQLLSLFHRHVLPLAHRESQAHCLVCPSRRVGPMLPVLCRVMDCPGDLPLHAHGGMPALFGKSHGLPPLPRHHYRTTHGFSMNMLSLVIPDRVFSRCAKIGSPLASTHLSCSVYWEGVLAWRVGVGGSLERAVLVCPHSGRRRVSGARVQVPSPAAPNGLCVRVPRNARDGRLSSCGLFNFEIYT